MWENGVYVVKSWCALKLAAEAVFKYKIITFLCHSGWLSLPGSVMIMCLGPKHFPSPLQVHGAASCHLCFCEWHFKYDTLEWQSTPWAVTSPAERWHHRLQWRTSGAYPHIVGAFMSKKKKKSALFSTWGMSGNVGLFHHKPESLCKFGLVTKGTLGLEWGACVQYFCRRNSLLVPVLFVQYNIWLCDKYSINSWNISSALHALISTRTQAYTQAGLQWWQQW